MEKIGCKIICGAPMTLPVKGLMMMMMMKLSTTHVSVDCKRCLVGTWLCETKGMRRPVWLVIVCVEDHGCMDKSG